MKPRDQVKTLFLKSLLDFHSFSAIAANEKIIAEIRAEKEKKSGEKALLEILDPTSLMAESSQFTDEVKESFPIDTIMKFVREGADPDTKDCDGLPLLHRVALCWTEGDGKFNWALEELVNTHGVDPITTVDSYKRPILRRIVDSGAQSASTRFPVQTTMFLASLGADSDDLGALLQWLVLKDDDGEHIPAIRELVTEYHVPIDYTESKRRTLTGFSSTPLQLVMNRRDYPGAPRPPMGKIVKALLELGANHKVKADADRTLLHLLVRIGKDGGHADIIEYLVRERHVNPDELTVGSKTTERKKVMTTPLQALMSASSFRPKNAMQLVRLGADPMVTDENNVSFIVRLISSSASDQLIEDFFQNIDPKLKWDLILSLLNSKNAVILRWLRNRDTAIGRIFHGCFMRGDKSFIEECRNYKNWLKTLNRFLSETEESPEKTEKLKKAMSNVMRVDWDLIIDRVKDGADPNTESKVKKKDNSETTVNLAELFSMCWMRGERLELEKLKDLLESGLDLDRWFMRLHPVRIVCETGDYDYALLMLSYMTLGHQYVFDCLIRDVSTRRASSSYLFRFIDVGLPAFVEGKEAYLTILRWLSSASPVIMRPKWAPLALFAESALKVIIALPELESKRLLELFLQKDNALGEMVSAAPDGVLRQARAALDTLNTKIAAENQEVQVRVMMGR